MGPEGSLAHCSYYRHWAVAQQRSQSWCTRVATPAPTPHHSPPPPAACSNAFPHHPPTHTRHPCHALHNPPHAGAYYGPENCNMVFITSTSLLALAGAPAPVIDCGGLSRAFTFTPAVGNGTQIRGEVEGGDWWETGERVACLCVCSGSPSGSLPSALPAAPRSTCCCAALPRPLPAAGIRVINGAAISGGCAFVDSSSPTFTGGRCMHALLHWRCIANKGPFRLDLYV